eukprot:5925779-Prymnesium_polylepis.1
MADDTSNLEMTAETSQARGTDGRVLSQRIARGRVAYARAASDEASGFVLRHVRVGQLSLLMVCAGLVLVLANLPLGPASDVAAAGGVWQQSRRHSASSPPRAPLSPPS